MSIYCEDYDDSKWDGAARENKLLRNKSTIFMQMPFIIKRRNIKCMGGVFFHMEQYFKTCCEVLVTLNKRNMENSETELQCF